MVLIKQLLSIGSEEMSEEYKAAQEKEIQELDRISKKPRLVNTVFIKGACVTGPKDLIDEIVKKMSNYSLIDNKLLKKC